MKSWIFLIAILLTINLSYAISINEINYNPPSYDNNLEYVEIYFENETNLTNYKIEDLTGYDNLTILNYIPGSNYALIVEEGFDYSGLDCSIYSAGNRIGGNDLTNSEDLVMIRDPEYNILNAIFYYSSWGGDGNGFSICKIPNINGLWQECGKTPCQPNSQLASETHKITITEFLPDPEGNDNDPMPEGEFIELYNHEEFTIDLQEYYLKDSANHKIIISNTNILNNNTEIKGNSYLAIYTNGYSGFLNNDGLEEIRLYNSNDQLINEVSYSNSQEDVSWCLIEACWQQTKPSPNEENIPANISNPAKLEIEKVYTGTDEKAKFGDLLRIKIFVNKGNATKESVQLYIEDEKGEKLSKTTKTSISKKYTDYSMTLPIQIFPNCKQKFPDDKYEIILEGLDLEDDHSVRIEGITKNLCEEVKQKCKSCPESYQEYYPESLESYESETVINPSSITGNVIFESTGIKSKRYGIYFFCALLFLIILQLIIKNAKTKN